MMPKDAASDNLSDEVERRIREAVKSWPRDRGEAAMNVEALHAIVSVAVEMLREERDKTSYALRTRADYDFRCDRCGAPHNLDTSIPSAIWNQIAPDGGALCTLCIDGLMAERGLVAEAEFYFVGKALTSRSYVK